ncbi:MAG: YihY/virulence factor BrkB family protein [Nocardioides sp.]
MTDTSTDRPDPDTDPDAGKVDSPDDLDKRSWAFVVRKTVREFSGDQCTDLAAALTYYAVLALFPAVVALTSLLGLVGQGTSATESVLDILGDLGAGSMVDTVREPLLAVSRSETAGLTFVLGLAGALWSASGYVGAFGRAMNRVYEVGEGRPVWKLRPAMLLLTVVLVVLVAAALLALVVSGQLAESVGNALGLGSTTVAVWDIAKLPVVLGVVVVIVALLYYVTPNIKQPSFRWVSVGAVLAILMWVLLSVAFGFYVANFSSYDKTYGALGGAIAFLLWLWLTNISLLFGAELDAELERGRELQSGIAAEETIQLPPRDTRNIEKTRKKEQDDIRRGRDLRVRRRRETRTDQLVASTS